MTFLKIAGYLPHLIVNKFSQEVRMIFGFWTFVFAGIGTIFFGTQVLWVSILSVVALIPNFTSETPVVTEESAKEKANA